jgi:hypothetical protein
VRGAIKGVFSEPVNELIIHGSHFMVSLYFAFGPHLIWHSFGSLSLCVISSSSALFSPHLGPKCVGKDHPLDVQLADLWCSGGT